MTYTWHSVGLSSQWMGECHSWPHSDSRRCPWWCVGVCYHECDQYCSCYLGLSFPSCSTGPVKLCWPAACWREMVWPPALRQVTVGRGSPADGQVQTSTFTQYMVLRVCFGHSFTLPYEFALCYPYSSSMQWAHPQLLTFNMTEDGGGVPCSSVQPTLAGVGEGGSSHNIQNHFL